MQVPLRAKRTLPAAAASIAVGLALLAVVPAVAGERPLDTILADVQAIEGQLKNATMRIKHVSGGVGSNPGGMRRANETPLSRPVADCCSRNVERIEERLSSIAHSLRELHSRAKTKNNQVALESISHMAESFGEARKRFGSFAGSEGGNNYALTALNRFWREVNHFKEATDRYVECCAVKRAPGSGKDSKKKKKKKKDQQASDADAGSTD